MKKTFVLLMLGLTLTLTACTEKKPVEMVEPIEQEQTTEEVTKIKIPRTNVSIDYQFGPTKHVIVEKIRDSETITFTDGNTFSIQGDRIYCKGAYAEYHGDNIFLEPFNDIIANMELLESDDKSDKYTATVTLGDSKRAVLTPIYWEWVDADTENSVDHLDFTIVAPKDSDEVCTIFSEDANMKMTICNIEDFSIKPSFDDAKGIDEGVVKKYEKQWKRCTSL